MDKRNHIRRALLRMVTAKMPNEIYGSILQLKEVSSFFKDLGKAEKITFAVQFNKTNARLTVTRSATVTKRPSMMIHLYKFESTNFKIDELSDQTITEVVEIIMGHLTREIVTRRFVNEKAAREVIDS